MFCTPNIFNGVVISAKIIFIEEEQQPGQHFQDRTARRGLTGHMREGPGQDRQERTVSKGQQGNDSQDWAAGTGQPRQLDRIHCAFRIFTGNSIQLEGFFPCSLFFLHMPIIFELHRQDNLLNYFFSGMVNFKNPPAIRRSIKPPPPSRWAILFIGQSV
jgi:hypothetical protein